MYYLIKPIASNLAVGPCRRRRETPIPHLDLEPLLEAMWASGWHVSASWQDHEFAEIELEHEAQKFLVLIAERFPIPQLATDVLPLIRQGRDVYLSLVPQRWTISTNYFDMVEDPEDAPWVHSDPRQLMVSVSIRFPKRDLKAITEVVCRDSMPMAA